MAVFSELSVLELDAERGELLPEREALQTVSTVTAIAPSATVTGGGAGSTTLVDQSTTLTSTITAPDLTGANIALGG